MSYEQLCMGCMKDFGNGESCQHCGYISGSEPKSLHHLTPGIILAKKYLIGTALGQGGFGITYLAWDINLDIKLAIKEYYPQGVLARVPGEANVATYSADAKEQFAFGQERFLNEAKTLAQFFEHPNIVTVRDFFRANNTAYMVMNYVAGITLEDYLRQAEGRLTYEQARAIMMPVLDALKEVHQAGILHRDVSPDNIFIDTRGRITLIDFGAARQEMQQKSRNLSVIMKIGYSPEEQYRSRGVQGPWTDIYAVAATFYRLISGEVPQESLDRLAEDRLLPPSEQGVEISSSAEQALLKALAVRGAERYQSIDEFQADLMNGSKVPVIEIEKQADQQVGVPAEERIIENKENNLNHEAKSEDMAADPGTQTSQKNRKAIIAVVAVIAAIGLIAGSIGLFGGSEATEISAGENGLDADAGEEQDVGTNTVEVLWDSGSYIGELKNNIPHGFGFWSTSSGYYYEGEWEEGLKHGYGTLVGNDGFTYEGAFKNDMFHGYGIMTWPNGDTYEGDLLEGEMTGWGTYTWADGAKYVGELLAGLKHGQGTLIEYEGFQIVGKWENDELVENETASDTSSTPVEEIDEEINDTTTPEIEENNEQKFTGTIYNNSDKKMIFYINDSPIAILQPHTSIRAVLPYGNAHIQAREDTLSSEQGVYIEHTKFIDGPDWTITFGSRF